MVSTKNTRGKITRPLLFASALGLAGCTLLTNYDIGQLIDDFRQTAVEQAQFDAESISVTLGEAVNLSQTSIEKAIIHSEIISDSLANSTMPVQDTLADSVADFVSNFSERVSESLNSYLLQVVQNSHQARMVNQSVARAQSNVYGAIEPARFASDISNVLAQVQDTLFDSASGVADLASRIPGTVSESLNDYLSQVVQNLHQARMVSQSVALVQRNVGEAADHTRNVLNLSESVYFVFDQAQQTVHAFLVQRAQNVVQNASAERVYGAINPAQETAQGTYEERIADADEPQNIETPEVRVLNWFTAGGEESEEDQEADFSERNETGLQRTYDAERILVHYCDLQRTFGSLADLDNVIGDYVAQNSGDIYVGANKQDLGVLYDRIFGDCSEIDSSGKERFIILGMDLYRNNNQKTTNAGE